MNNCWSFEPEDRPQFSFLLQELEQFHEKCETLLADYIMPVRTRPIDGEYIMVEYHSLDTTFTTVNLTLFFFINLF